MTIKFAALETNADFAKHKQHFDARRGERSAFRTERDTILERIRARSDVITDGGEAERISAIARGEVPRSKAQDELRLGELNKIIRELDAAIELLNKQMNLAANRHSIAVCAALRKQHDVLAVALFDSVVSANQAAHNYKQFLETLRVAGIFTHHFPQNVTPNFLEADSKHGRMAAWFDEMANSGIVTRSKIPDGMDFRK